MFCSPQAGSATQAAQRVSSCPGGIKVEHPTPRSRPPRPLERSGGGLSNDAGPESLGPRAREIYPAKIQPLIANNSGPRSPRASGPVSFDRAHPPPPTEFGAIWPGNGRVINRKPHNTQVHPPPLSCPSRPPKELVSQLGKVPRGGWNQDSSGNDEELITLHLTPCDPLENTSNLDEVRTTQVEETRNMLVDQISTTEGQETIMEGQVDQEPIMEGQVEQMSTTEEHVEQMSITVEQEAIMEEQLGQMEQATIMEEKMSTTVEQVEQETTTEEQMNTMERQGN
ncbi:hypothetical protein Q8A67_016860 [Cirrhinus molitorella]|uniref:Uncharacterized protein n=1 Tax=Cirrhinus molitorella TaxID=172907 RepID=A0AA88TL73_9TELE|nr:hypothetical protein Q8A67_016860 [Cirrhinus molitorella]